MQVGRLFTLSEFIGPFGERVFRTPWSVIQDNRSSRGNIYQMNLLILWRKETIMCENEKKTTQRKYHIQKLNRLYIIRGISSSSSKAVMIRNDSGY